MVEKKKTDKKLMYLLIGVIVVLTMAVVFFILNPVSTPVTKVSTDVEAGKVEKDVSKDLVNIKETLQQINEKLK